MGDDRSRTWSGGSSLQVSFGSQMEKNGIESKVNCLLKHLPRKVKDFNWELKNEFSKSLNPLKKSGSDWRKLASRLGFSDIIISQLEGKENPTIELLRDCTETTAEMLLGILVEMKRSDVLDDILKFLKIVDPNLSATQESLNSNDSCASSLSWPLQESGSDSFLDETGASRGRLGAQESEEAEEDFLSDESQKFWVNIPGDYEQKKLTNFVQAAKNQCPTEMQQGNMEKFLCKIWQIECGQLARNDSYVTLNSFLTLVALFGPFKPGPDGCLQKWCNFYENCNEKMFEERQDFLGNRVVTALMYDIMKKSISKREGNIESWFAGNMDETEAANILGSQSPGHFLIRISSSRAHEGVFVLAVKTRDNGVVQIPLERDLQDNTLLLADQKYSDLMSIVTALRDDALLANCRQLLINPCPGLPLNAVFTGYEKGTARRGGRGRGKQLR